MIQGFVFLVIRAVVASIIRNARFGGNTSSSQGNNPLLVLEPCRERVGCLDRCRAGHLCGIGGAWPQVLMVSVVHLDAPSYRAGDISAACIIQVDSSGFKAFFWYLFVVVAGNFFV